MGRLQDERNIWLATVRPDGRPHVAPVWFVFVDDTFWVGTGERSVKVRNLRASHRATVALEDGNAPVVAECTGSVRERPYPPAAVAAFRAKYDWDLDVVEDADVGVVTLVELRVNRWLFGGPTA